MFENANLLSINNCFLLKTQPVNNANAKNRLHHGFVYFIHADSIYRFGSKKLVVKDNSILYLPKGGNYHIHHEKNVEAIVLDFEIENDNKTKEFVYSDRHMKDIFDDILFTYTKHLETKQLRLKTLFYSLLEKVEQISSNHQKDENDIKIEQAVKYIEDHYYEMNLTSKDIVNLFKYSYRYVLTLFKNKTSFNINEYINNVRVNAAKKLLLTTQNNLEDIAHSCGFDNACYFCRVFKKNTGYSPNAFKRQHNT